VRRESLALKRLCGVRAYPDEKFLPFTKDPQALAHDQFGAVGVMRLYEIMH
jgi:hypothetical protein